MEDLLEIQPEYTVQRVLPLQWEQFRDIRIRAVSDSPQAFGDSREQTETREKVVWLQWITNSNIYVVENKNVFVASATLRKNADNIWIINGVWTDPEHRKKGLSKKLFGQIFQDASSMKIDSIELHVNPVQNSAVSLYESLGFCKTGVLTSQLLGDGSYGDLDVFKKKLA
jgi:predicted GNAT family acetyltransferase